MSGEDRNGVPYCYNSKCTYAFIIPYCNRENVKYWGIEIFVIGSLLFYYLRITGLLQNNQINLDK